MKLSAHGTTPDHWFPVFPFTVFSQWLNSVAHIIAHKPLFVTLIPESAGKMGTKHQTPNAKRQTPNAKRQTPYKPTSLNV
jgi:hypothetical protein